MLFQQVETDMVVVSSHDDLGIGYSDLKKLPMYYYYFFSDNSAIWDRLPLEGVVYWRQPM